MSRQVITGLLGLRFEAIDHLLETLIPADGSGSTVDTLNKPVGVHRGTVWQRVALTDGIYPPECDRVHAQLFGHTGHVRFKTEMEFRIPEAPVWSAGG